MRRLGTDGSTAQGRAAARARGTARGRRDRPRAGRRTATASARGAVDDDSARADAALVTRAPVTTGARLADIFLEWAVRHVQVELGRYFDNALVLFFSGVANRKLATAMAEYTPNLQLRRPAAAARRAQAADLAGRAVAVRQRRALRRRLGAAAACRARRCSNAVERSYVLRKAMQKATVVVAPVHELDGFGLEELAGKTIITSTVNDERLAQLRATRACSMVVDGAPLLFGHVRRPDAARRDDPRRHRQGARATCSRTTTSRSSPSLELEPRIALPERLQAHQPLRLRHPPAVAGVLQEGQADRDAVAASRRRCCMDSLEKVMAYAPPFVYSKVEGIKSPTGVEAEGWLISVGGTPQRDHEPQPRVHLPPPAGRRRDGRASWARRSWAWARSPRWSATPASPWRERAPLPITTGNSYSASGALWAAHDALLRMGLLPQPDGEAAREVQGDGRRRHRRHRLGLRAAAGDAPPRRSTLVSPETAKLLALKESILQETPDAKVFLSRARRQATSPRWT
ncbi:MAG: hypothetical protein MZW92_20850 [Comamonadaceae bacterium]|nr:hypothetical protein [Comamonadaceae bacterium]